MAAQQPAGYGRSSEGGGRSSESGGRHSDNGGRYFENGGRNSESGGRYSDTGGRYSENGGRYSENGGRNLEGGRMSEGRSSRSSSFGASTTGRRHSLTGPSYHQPQQAPAPTQPVHAPTAPPAPTQKKQPEINLIDEFGPSVTVSAQTLLFDPLASVRCCSTY